MTIHYGLAMGRGNVLAPTFHIIDARDGEPIPWTARCGQILNYRCTTVEDTITICPECETHK